MKGGWGGGEMQGDGEMKERNGKQMRKVVLGLQKTEGTGSMAAESRWAPPLLWRCVVDEWRSWTCRTLNFVCETRGFNTRHTVSTQKFMNGSVGEFPLQDAKTQKLSKSRLCSCAVW